RQALLAQPEVMTHALVHKAAKGERGLRAGGTLRVVCEFEFQGTFLIGRDGCGAQLELAVWTRRNGQAGPCLEVRVDIIGGCVSAVTKQTPLPGFGPLGRGASPMPLVATHHGRASLASDLRDQDAFDVAS